MITKITRGDDMGGLVNYLTGPGRSNEHTDPQVVGSSQGVDVPLGQELSIDERRALIDQLDAPSRLTDTEVEGGYVWHLSLTIPEGDGKLINGQWAEAAREVSAEMGFSGEDVSEARWVAIRHGASSAGNDHVHMAVSLVREDGRIASNWQDRVKVASVAGRLEQRFGLTVVEGRTAGATPGATRAEREQADRQGRPETDRERLARTVRGSALSSRDEAEFVRRLRERGVAVRPRFAKDNDWQVTGYSVAIAGRDEPVWFGGGTLAKDLRLPALRDGWGAVEDQQAAWTRPEPTSVEHREGTAMTGEGWQLMKEALAKVTDELGNVAPDDNQGWANAARHASGMYAELSQRLEGDEPGPLARAAGTLARSAQKADRHHQRPDLAGLAAVVGQATMKGKAGTAGWIILAGELLRLSKALAELHAARAEQLRATELLTGARAVRAASKQHAHPRTARTKTMDPSWNPEMVRRPDRGTDWGR